MYNPITHRHSDYAKPQILSNLLILAACGIFGFLYVNLIYDAFGAEHWRDLNTYETVFNDPYYHYAQLNRTWISWVKDEPLWYEVILTFRSITRTDVETINIISIFSSAVIAFCVYQISNKKWWAVVLLINPSTIDLIISQVRSAFGLSILMIVLLNPPWWAKILLIITAGTIHTSMYLFGVIYIIIQFYDLWTDKNSRFNSKWIIIVISAIIAFTISIAAPYILGAIGDRRVGIESDAIGILYGIVWLTFVITYYYFGKFDNYIFPHFFYTICSFIAIFSIFSETYGSRYITVAIPFLIVMIVRQSNPFRTFFIIQYIFIMTSYYYYYLWQAGFI